MHFISKTQAVCRSAHTGRPILQELNPLYGYWATVRLLTEEEYSQFKSLPEYSE
jgi:hypothetical protein